MKPSMFLTFIVLFIKGIYSEWSEWSSCSETCQSDPNTYPLQVRTNDCQIGGCSGPTIQTRSCNVHVGCPGSWGLWTPWGACSASCQITSIQPQALRYRVCSGGNFEKKCDGQKETESQACNTVVCEGQISNWGSWSVCPELCSVASTTSRKRTRTCSGYSTWDPNFFGCTGIIKSEEEPCYGKFPCKGTYTDWENWSSCSETCQSNLNASPSQSRVRQCVGDNLGGGCTGNNQQSRNCNEQVPCPGSWGTWTVWGVCSATCQMTSTQPQKSRYRYCSGGTFSQRCDGQRETESQACNSVVCEGFIMEWSAWSLCPLMCSAASTALHSRTRTCVGFSTYDPSFTGCVGYTRLEEEPCSGRVPCKGTYGEWGKWSDCSETCQSDIRYSPSQYRARLCIGDIMGGGCDGNARETKSCNSLVACPGKVTEWETWSQCTKDCSIIDSIPKRSRRRSCIQFTFGGKCNGDLLEQFEECESYNCKGQTWDWKSSPSKAHYIALSHFGWYLILTLQMCIIFAFR